MSSEQRLQQMQAEIEELQSRQAFQEETLASLDRVIGEQDQQLLRQQRQLLLLGEKLKLLEGRVDSGGVTAVDQKPPHY